MYSATLLRYFESPKFAGEMSDPDAAAQKENPACGDVLRLSLKLSDTQIVQARFLAKGCVPTMALGSVLAELITGMTCADAWRLEPEDLVAAAGGVPLASSHAGCLAIEVLRAALTQITDDAGPPVTWPWRRASKPPNSWR